MQATRRDLLRATLGVAAAAQFSGACSLFGGPGQRMHGRRGASPEDYMRMAIELVRGDPFPYGALLVNRASGEVVGVGGNRSLENPTRHGEIVAIDDYFSRLGWFGDLEKAISGLRDMALYTTAEPCAMCIGAIAWARIPEVYFGSSIPFLIQNDQWQIDIRAATIANAVSFEKTKTKLTGGILEAECNALFAKR